MRFDWVTFGLQIVNVLVLLAILRHFLFRPVVGMIARRQADISAAQDAAQADRAAAAAVSAAAKAEAENTAAARHSLLEAARADAKDQRKELIAAARSAAAKILGDARMEAARVSDDARTETLHRARDLAGTIAHSACSALPAPPTPGSFAERLVRELGAMHVDKRKALLSGDCLRLVSVFDLSSDDLAAVRASLAPFGLERMSVETDPGLIAGLDLRSSTGVIYNALAHDLHRISEALRDDDGSRT